LKYGQLLIDIAVEVCGGSAYQVAQRTGIPLSNLQKARKGHRGVPLSWVIPLCAIAKIDPHEAHARIKAEKLGNDLRKVASWLVGAVAMLLFSLLPNGAVQADVSQKSSGQLNTIHIVFRWLRLQCQSFKQHADRLRSRLARFRTDDRAPAHPSPRSQLILR